MLHLLGAEVAGYALEPPTIPNLFEQCRIHRLIKNSRTGDIRDARSLAAAMLQAGPEIVIHMAAQPLVRESYLKPVETYDTNVMGTVNLFEAVRKCKSVKAVIIVTSDKCYENKEWLWSYRENEPLGGYDPYSGSKACTELVTASYRSSFFNPGRYCLHGVGIASVRAGNVIGGGDWARNRLVPDCIRAFLNKEKIIIRSPNSVRPWQHVLEPLSGYLMLAERLYENGPDYGEGWNFGPDEHCLKTVEWVVRQLCEEWGVENCCEIKEEGLFHEAGILKLDSSKAKYKLKWFPRYDLETALSKTVKWAKAYQNNENIRETCLKEIQDYFDLIEE